MRNLISIAFFVLLFAISSCGKIIFWFSGVHDPRLESLVALDKKASEYGITEKPILGLKESYQLLLLKKRFNADVLFDRNGYELLYNKIYEKENCKGNIIQLLAGLGKETFIERDSTSKINLEAEGWQFIDRDSNSFVINDYLRDADYDYFLVSYWNVFSGVQNNKNRLKELFLNVNKNERIKIKHIFVNQDFRENMTSFEIEK